MSEQWIVVKGAREHNLQSVNVSLPRNTLICLTGISGSGKSSFVFDTLYAEGERRYLQSLSTTARHFVGQMPRPNVDLVEGISPPIAISQKTSSSNPRSTVGTLTEIYDFLRLLFARAARCYCPLCERPIGTLSVEAIIQQLSEVPRGSQLTILAPVVCNRKGDFSNKILQLRRQGWVQARIDGQLCALSEVAQLNPTDRHTMEIVVDQLVASPEHKTRLAESVRSALALGEGLLTVLVRQPNAHQDESHFFSQANHCPACNISFPTLTPQSFSFNHIGSMCLFCTGLGTVKTWDFNRIFAQDSLPVARLWTLTDLVSSMWLRRYVHSCIMLVPALWGNSCPITVWNRPWKDWPEIQKRQFLFGSQAFPYLTPGQRGEVLGVVAELNRQYRRLKSRKSQAKYEHWIVDQVCPVCNGSRLLPHACSVRLRSAHSKFEVQPERSLPELCHLAIETVRQFMSDLVLDPIQQQIAEDILREVRARLGFLVEVGVGYLTLDRPAPTLSGGEAQRIRIASQIGSGLVGCLYVLDEPSIGLHARDNQQLLQALRRLRDAGNTVVVVEHDEETMRAADWIVDFGPGAGRRGGRVMAQGPVSQIVEQPESLTGQYLAGRQSIPIPAQRHDGNGQYLRIVGASQNNLKNITVEFPLGKFICVTGVSGSGKSSLVQDILIESLHQRLNRGVAHSGRYERIEGWEALDKIIAINQSPIGRTPRSNPATYVKLFDEIRKFFTKLPEARRRGFPPGRFSFNVPGGRCERCKGNGALRVQMDFLADVWIQCPACQGKRFNRETLQVRYKDHSISDVLQLDVLEAHVLFDRLPTICNKLKILQRIGLDYLQLGQPSPTLSGGEAQRMKLARELSKRSTGKTLYVLDEPTTGLHFADIQRLLEVLHGFVDAGNTVIVVEHNLDVIKTADWIIDLGPEGGEAGGYVVAVGTPEHIATREDSYTGRALRAVLNRATDPAATLPAVPHPTTASNGHLRIRGAAQHNLKHVDLDIPRNTLTVFCGPSGSGKTSLAMDTLYAEGQRRYVESLSPHARQFISQMPKPRVEHVDGLSPAIALQAQSFGKNPRSTVGTVTEIYDYLRVLYARLGQPYCPKCQVPVGPQTPDQIVDRILGHPEGTLLMLLAPVATDESTHFQAMWEELQAEGYRRVRINGQTHSIEQVPQKDPKSRPCIEVVIDRWQVRRAERSRLAESVQLALSLGEGKLHVAYAQDNVPEARWKVVVHSVEFSCSQCGRSFEPLEPRHFSFNSRAGWCPACQGLGNRRTIDPRIVFSSPRHSIREGLLEPWPNPSDSFSRMILRALKESAGLPDDVPYAELSPSARRILWFGHPDWIELPVDGGGKVKFRFCGIQGAIERVARACPQFAYHSRQLFRQQRCILCQGSGLRDESAAVRFEGKTIVELSRMTIRELLQTVRQWKLNPEQEPVGNELVREILSRLQFLLDVDLDYLTLNRRTATLSHGEAQRIRLASQLGSGLTGVLYVLDEPTVGLHPNDNHRLIGALKKLRDLGNTLVVVEHDREVIAAADQVVDFGPQAGRHGGRVVAKGTPDTLVSNGNSVTAPFLIATASELRSRGRLRVVGPTRVGEQPCIPLSDVEHCSQPGPCPKLVIHHARRHNLREITVELPLKSLVCITGPSGSGKSTLIHDVLYEELQRAHARLPSRQKNCDQIEGWKQISRIKCVDQSPLGNSPSSTPVTFAGVFDEIRRLFAEAAREQNRTTSPETFSFTSSVGMCPSCRGMGQICVKMQFLSDVWVPCQVCQGRRYQPWVLQIRYRSKTIADVLELTCQEAREFFADQPKIAKVFDLFCDLGLGYLLLGQSIATLSGGESQRLKLIRELASQAPKPLLYLLDEPTTGLHFRDIERLVAVLQRLVDQGHTVVVIEHNLDLIQAADWLIDLGPGAGKEGGYVVAAGTVDHVIQWAERSKVSETSRRTPTGEALRDFFEKYVPHRSIEPHQTSEATNVYATLDMKSQTEHSSSSSGMLQLIGQTPPNRILLQAVLRKIEKVSSFAQPWWSKPDCVEITGQDRTDWFCRALLSMPDSLVLQFRVTPPINERDLPTGSLPVTVRPELHSGAVREPLRQEAGSPECAILEAKLQRLDQVESADFDQLFDQLRERYWKQPGTECSTLGLREARQALNCPWKTLKQAWHLSTKRYPEGEVSPRNLPIIRSIFASLEYRVAPELFVWDYPDHFQIRDYDDRSWFWLWTKRLGSVALDLLKYDGILSKCRYSYSGRVAYLKNGIIRWVWRNESDFRCDERALAAILARYCAEFASPRKGIRHA